MGGVKFVQDEGLRLGRWRLGIFIRGNWAKNPIFDQGFKWVWLLLLMRRELLQEATDGSMSYGTDGSVMTSEFWFVVREKVSLSFVRWVSESCGWVKVNALLLMGKSCWSMKVNTLRIWCVEDEGNDRSDEKKRRERRFVTSGGTHGFKGIYSAATRKRCLLFKNRS